MGRSLHKLTPIAIKNAKKPGLYGDGGGLYLQVSQCGTKAWLYRFMRHGVARKMGLGAVHTVPLNEARQRAAAARLAVLDGIDPIATRDAQRAAAKLEAAKAVTFRIGHAGQSCAFPRSCKKARDQAYGRNRSHSGAPYEPDGFGCFKRVCAKLLSRTGTRTRRSSSIERLMGS